MHFEDCSKQGFTGATLAKTIKPEDEINWDITPENINTECKKISNLFFKNNCKTEGLRRGSFRGKKVYMSKNFYDVIISRRANYIINNFIKSSIINKEDEVRQLYNILRTEPEGTIVYKGDIKSFFENCDFHKTISILLKMGFNNETCISYIKSIHSEMIADGDRGLPRGLSISSVFANIAMLSFDKKIVTTPGVLYYCRYVDDFVVIYCDKELNLIKIIDESLSEFGLSRNPKKSKSFFVGEHKSFDFLGYSLPLTHSIPISISENKINRTKARIALAFKDFNLNSDFNLFYDRIKSITSSIRMRKIGRQKPIYIGFRHQYALCKETTILNQLKSLDKFYHALLHSKRYALSRNIRAKLSKVQLKKLSNISFFISFKRKITIKCNGKRINKIQSAWKYAKI